MKAVVLKKPGLALIESISVPVSSQETVLLKVRMVGLCGSDLNAFRGKNPMIAFSRVLGHEVAATLMEDVEEIRTPSSTFMRTSSKPSRRRKTCSIRQKAIAVGEAHIDCRAIGGAQCSQDFDHACAVDPRSARAPRRSTASVVRCSRGQTGDATTIFRRNVVLHPEDANVYDSLAEAYMKAGRKNLAISNYEHSLKLNPQNENARMQLKKLHS